MGRQLPIVATCNDERDLLRFMRKLSPIRVYISFAGKAEDLWVTDWEHQDIADSQFNVWLESFPWEPEYKQTGGPGCPKERSGFWYISNGMSAPVIEVARATKGSIGGRIYWSRDFCAPLGLGYDVTAFDRIVNQIWNWVRRSSCRRKIAGKLNSPYFLPDAWRTIGSI